MVEKVLLFNSTSLIDKTFTNKKRQKHAEQFQRKQTVFYQLEYMIVNLCYYLQLKNTPIEFVLKRNQNGEIIRGNDCGPNPGFRHGKREEVELLVRYVLFCKEIVMRF